MKRIAILASGSGSNAQCIIEHFQENKDIEVVLLLSNRPDAYALQRAENLGIATGVFNHKDFYDTDTVVKKLEGLHIDLIVLAGFLWLIPEQMIQTFPRRIINIHPALLPKFGGKGMYGSRVHKAVIAAKEQESGISIHYVNEHFDEGEIIDQFKYTITPEDNADSIALKGQQLEHRYFPEVIESLLLKVKN